MDFRGFYDIFNPNNNLIKEILIQAHWFSKLTEDNLVTLSDMQPVHNIY